MTHRSGLPLASLASNPRSSGSAAGPIAVVGDMWQMTKQTAVALAYFPAKVFYTAYNLVTGQPRDIYGPMSIVGASRAAGEIASTDQIDAAAKVASLFTVLGAVNLFVALFNFVPLLPLDGGHVARRSTRRSDGPSLASADDPIPVLSTRRGCCPWRTLSAV